MEAREHHVEVVRTARYWVLGGEVARPAEVWFVLHGYQQLAGRFLRRFHPLADGSRWVVAPEALNRFYVDQAPGRHGPTSAVGATWMTRDDREHEIRDYVRYLDHLHDTVMRGIDGPSPRLVVLGFSQGVATAARWTTLGAVRPARLVLWGDYLPPDLPLEPARVAWQGVDLVLARGDRDGIFGDPSWGRAEAERLAAADIRHRLVSYAGGHDIHQPTLQALAAEVSSPR
jgi:predicted esterase